MALWKTMNIIVPKEKPHASVVCIEAQARGLAEDRWLEDLFEAEVRGQHFSEAFPLLWGNSSDSLEGMK